MQRGYLPPASPFDSPAGVEFYEDPNVLQSVARLAKALSWNGVANIDLRVEEPDGSLDILEVNPRFWRTLMGSLAAGVNFPYLACLHGMGESVKQLPYKPIRFIPGNNTALKRRMRWHSREKMLDKVEERSSLEYVMRDPMPEVFMILRAALGRRSPESLLSRDWEMRLGTEADNP
jgi:predicted ATP-grasp superfamily ATP-dependent carboligase